MLVVYHKIYCWRRLQNKNKMHPVLDENAQHGQTILLLHSVYLSISDSVLCRPPSFFFGLPSRRRFVGLCGDVGTSSRLMVLFDIDKPTPTVSDIPTPDKLIDLAWKAPAGLLGLSDGMDVVLGICGGLSSNSWASLAYTIPLPSRTILLSILIPRRL